MAASARIRRTRSSAWRRNSAFLASSSAFAARRRLRRACARNVDEGSELENAIGGPKLAEPEFDRHRRAVLALADQFAGHAGGFEIVQRILGDEHADLLADQLIAIVAEERLGARIDQQDLPVRRDHHHGIRRGLDHHAETLLGLLPLDHFRFHGPVHLGERGGLAKEIDEDADLRAQHRGIDRLGDVIDRAPAS
ncbi:MAG: hypothetical protein WDN28_32355 [Chthoniobacter sp.]